MTLEKLVHLRDASDKALREFKDGYKYVVVCSSYGSSHRQYANNHVIAGEIADHYNGDNGHATIHTTNTHLSRQERDGESIEFHTYSEFNKMFN